MGITAERDRRTALRDLMDEQDGLATTSQLRGLGFSPRENDGMVRRKELIRVRRGLFRGRGVRWDLRAELRAALIEQGAGARLVLISALHWQGLLYRPATLPEVGIPGTGDVQVLDHRVVHRTPYVAAAEPVQHDGLPCSAPIDALPHLAGHIGSVHATRRAFRRALREAVRKDGKLVSQLEKRADDGRFRGIEEIRAGLRSLPHATVVKSDLEEDFIRFCEIWGLPPFLMNRKVGGVERDAVRLEEQVIVELDTRGYHGNLIALEADRRRRRRATVAGWKHLEITGHDLRDEPRRVAHDLAALLVLRGWSPPADAGARWADVITSARGVWLPRR